MPDFDEWMSGRYWLGDKAPAEGFYSRYTERQIEFMRIAYLNGANFKLNRIFDQSLTDDDYYLIKWTSSVARKFAKRHK
jgi:hypothetical protein